MRIAIINITGGGMSGGYRKYLQNIIPRIASNPVVGAILCVTPASLNIQNWVDQLPNVKFVNCQPFRLLHHSPDSHCRLHLEKFAPDVIFIPMGRYLHYRKIPIVNMVQNMEPLIFSFNNSDNISIKQKIRILTQLVIAKKAVGKAHTTIAVSGFVKESLKKKWNMPDDKISLVYYGVNDPGNEIGQKPHIILESWKNIFLFTAGSIRPARGLEDLLLAMKHVGSQHKDIVRLVIAGETEEPSMTTYQKKLKNWIQANNLSDRICWTGRLNEKEMAWCYQNCRAFVMSSRVESFGMTGGEAMSYGCNCISANNPCLPELFGDAAIFYPPKNGEILANAIKTVFAWDNNQQNTMSEKAKKQAAKFSWHVCAAKVVALLAKAVAR